MPESGARSLEEGAGKRCSECGRVHVDKPAVEMKVPSDREREDGAGRAVTHFLFRKHREAFSSSCSTCLWLGVGQVVVACGGDEGSLC